MTGLGQDPKSAYDAMFRYDIELKKIAGTEA